MNVRMCKQECIKCLISKTRQTPDKGDGSVRPVGVGEVFRRIMTKCLIQITKPDILDVTRSLQVSAGQKSGSEAAVHAINSMFSADETDAVLLIDATNAFNTLNRAAALRNISINTMPHHSYICN